MIGGLFVDGFFVDEEREIIQILLGRMVLNMEKTSFI